MKDSIKISKIILDGVPSDFSVGDWKKLRIKLYQSEANWPVAFEVFENRINSRFLDPIEIIKKNGKNEGEGFSIALISVVLLEFLAAFEQGKIYKTHKEGISPNEYYSGIKLLKSFLRSSNVFRQHFDSNEKIQRFYENVRCGLVHEARTMKNDVIISNDSIKNTKNDLLYFSENGEGRLNRDLFLGKIKEHISDYKSKILKIDTKLRNRFILKMDEISGLKHVWYFIYGSNLFEEQLNNRLKSIGDRYLQKIRCSLKGYKFIYNKKSNDGSTKGNLIENQSSVVQGIAILLLESTLDAFILNYEQGYRKNEVKIMMVNDDNYENQVQFKAYTCLSENIITAPPSQDYVSKILNGARENHLPEEYILTNLIF
jgi:hypothetical protein